MPEFTEEVKRRALEMGADEVAVAPVERWAEPPPYDARSIHVYPQSGYVPTDLMPSCRSVIVVTVRLLDGVVDTTTTASRTTSVQGNFGYVFLNRRLNDITFGLSSWLEARGHRSVPMGYNIGSRYNAKADHDPSITAPAFGLFSMKRAAVLAGLGRKAKNGLVASPKHGTRMRLGGLLTAAALVADPLLEGDPCPPSCDICWRVCPTQAISREGRISHLRCYADAGRRGMDFEELKASFKQRYPAADGDDDYTLNDYLAMEGNDNRVCKIACVAFCPLGERPMPDVMRRVREFAEIVPPVRLRGFPPAPDFDV
jgi:epoxyqueuosine reductase QueG